MEISGSSQHQPWVRNCALRLSPPVGYFVNGAPQWRLARIPCSISARNSYCRDELGLALSVDALDRSAIIEGGLMYQGANCPSAPQADHHC